MKTVTYLNSLQNTIVYKEFLSNGLTRAVK